MTEELKKNEVTEEQLEGVSGGGSWSTYSSGDTPKFCKGQIVYYDDGTSWQELAYIKEVSKEKSGLIYKEFTYTIEVFGQVKGKYRGYYGTHRERSGIWESDLKPADT